MILLFFFFRSVAEMDTKGGTASGSTCALSRLDAWMFRWMDGHGGICVHVPRVLVGELLYAITGSRRDPMFRFWFWLVLAVEGVEGQVATVLRPRTTLLCVLLLCVLVVLGTNRFWFSTFFAYA